MTPQEYDNLTSWATQAMRTFRADYGMKSISPDEQKHISGSAAITTGKQAKRMNVSWDDVVKWLQDNYGKVWVVESKSRIGSQRYTQANEKGIPIK